MMMEQKYGKALLAFNAFGVKDILLKSKGKGEVSWRPTLTWD